MPLRILTFCILFIFPFVWANPQSVGLVLSGGGAKGCTHVGVIKALEENNIPIDYIAGTSMGAIVGSLYAMGYTPEEMEALLVSPDFQIWLKGYIDEKSKFYFKEEEETPEFISFKLSIDDSLSLKPVIPSSVLSPDQLNQACMMLFSQATTACEGDFNKLFVPFRCVASDVTNKKEYVHRSGDLGDAVRTSMSFPFVFKPIRVKGHIMVDGGIYNNFPVDIMEKELKAEYIIGCSVSDGPAETQEEDPIALMENLIIQRSDYPLPEGRSMLLNFHYKDVSLLDFQKASQLIQIGYDSTMAHIEEIKSQIKRRVSKEEVDSKRFSFNQKKPQLTFKNVIIHGVKSQQQKFIAKTFHWKQEYFNYNNFKRNYFKLLSDKKIAEIIPHAVYNKETNAYDLILDVKLNDHLKFGIGGNVSSSTFNQLYVSAKYLGIRHLSYDVCLDGQIGMLYSNAHFQTRIDFPYQFPFCLKIIGDINHSTYSNKQNAFYETDIPTKAYSTEFHTKGKICIPFLLKGEVDAGMGLGKIKNKYHGLYTTEEENYDKTNYKLGVSLLQYRYNSQSHKQYPISGTRVKVSAQYIFGEKESITRTPIDSIQLGDVKQKSSTKWIQLSAKFSHYIPTGKHFSLGLMAEGVYSTHPLEDNYMETLIMSPTFTPTKHSRMVYNTAFCANTYLAVGVNPIYRINDILQIRWENYLYAPHKPIVPTAKFAAAYGKAFSKGYLLSEISGVAQLRYITASVYANWYSYPKKNFNVGLNIGYLIFHDKLIE